MVCDPFMIRSQLIFYDHWHLIFLVILAPCLNGGGQGKLYAIADYDYTAIELQSELWYCINIIRLVQEGGD